MAANNVRKFHSELIELLVEQAKDENKSYDHVLTEYFVDYLGYDGLAFAPEFLDCENTDCKVGTLGEYYKINGFDYYWDDNEDSGTLSLYASCFIEKNEVVEFSKSKKEIYQNAMYRFFMACIENDNLMKKYQDSPEVLELIESIRDEYKAKHIKTIRLFILTNGEYRQDRIESIPIAANSNIVGELYIRDIVTATLADESMKNITSTDVDFEDEYPSLPCILCDDNPEMRSYLTVIPGLTLGKIYEQYGVKLLSRNVRQYLGGKVKKNKGMIETLRDSGQRFFAYNNGITSTADRVDVKKNEEGTLMITGLENWQIVNGGQTTNVISYIYSNKGKNDDRNKLSNVKVSLKITELKMQEESNKQEAISEISRLANTQNQIKDSDFAVNDPVLRKLKNVSEKELTPHNSQNPDTQWFFVRMRGEYETAKLAKTDKNSIKLFEAKCPKNQVLDKHDLAKLEMAWRQMPNLASLGAAKCFDKYWDSIKALRKKEEEFEVDEKFFHELVAKAIICRKILELYQKDGKRGYTNIVQNYVLSMLAHKSYERLNLQYIWENQEIQPNLYPILEKAIEIVAAQINKAANNNENVTESAKKNDFWQQIKLQMSQLPEFDKTLLLAYDSESLTVSQKAALDNFSKVSAETWKSIAEWGKESRKISLLERKKVENVLLVLKKEKEITHTTATDLLQILKKATSMGWQE